MPVDIAPQVEAEYTDAIPAPLDGEYANATALQALVLPVANRVEYLRQGLESGPWREFTLIEDFVSEPYDHVDADFTSFDRRWATDTAFDAYTMTGIPVVDADDSLGVVSFANSSGTARDGLARQTEGCVIARDVRRAVARIQLGSIASGMGFAVGFDFVGGTPAVRAIFAPATSPNWLLQTGSGAVNADSGVAVAANAWYQLDLVHDGASGWSLAVNGGAPVSAVSGQPAIGATMTPSWRITTPNSGLNRVIYLDFLYYRSLVQARVL